MSCQCGPVSKQENMCSDYPNKLKPKLSFEEWFDTYRPYTEQCSDLKKDFFYIDMLRAWEAGQDNK